MIDYIKVMLSDGAAASFGRCGAAAIVTVQLVICGILSLASAKIVDIPFGWAGLATTLFGITKIWPTSSQIAAEAKAEAAPIDPSKEIQK